MSLLTMTCRLRDPMGPELPFATDSWDGGRVIVNRDFAELLQRNGLTTFAAFQNLSGGQIVREVGHRITSRVLLRDGANDVAFYLKRHGPPSLWDRIRPLLHL